jgi:MraZ protein
VQRFVGTFVNKLDSKGRVSVPAPFRSVLTQQGGVLYLTRAIGNKALNGYGEAQFAEVDEQLKAMNPLRSKDYAAYAMAAFGDVTALTCDDDGGRVVVPPALIEFAQLKDKVQFVGLNRIFEIWNPDTFAPVAKARWDRINALYGEGEGEGA